MRQLVPRGAFREVSSTNPLFVLTVRSSRRRSRVPPAKFAFWSSPGSISSARWRSSPIQAEPFTVTALEMTVVLEVPKAAVHRLMQHSPSFRETMDEI